jgi:hypothetical protein
MTCRSTEVFRCLVKACAPPPVGTGGSSKIGEISRKYAERLLRNAKQSEPGVTATLNKIVGAAGGKLEGLEFMFKDVQSLTRKIHDKAKERNTSLMKSASRIVDALRYTAVTDEKNYAATVHNTLKGLRREGFGILEVETHWKRGDSYNGIHVIAKHPNGTNIEIQFHTTASFAAKQANHKWYERARKTDDPVLRKELNAKMTARSDTSPIPPGALKIGKKVYRP